MALLQNLFLSGFLIHYHLVTAELGAGVTDADGTGVAINLPFPT